MVVEITHKLSNRGLCDALNWLPIALQYDTPESETILDKIEKLDCDWNLIFQSKQSFFGVNCEQFTHIDTYSDKGLRFSSVKNKNVLTLIFENSDGADSVIRRLQYFGFVD